MIFGRKNNNENHPVRLPRESYLVVNLIFAGVIMLIIAYSGIFSPDKNNYPITCIHEKLTGLPCVSCGLSHSFSLIVRGRLAEAHEWNPFGLRVFLFFAAQLLLRVFFSIFWQKHPDTRQQLIIVDCIGSGIMVLVAFWPFIRAIL